MITQAETIASKIKLANKLQKLLKQGEIRMGNKPVKSISYNCHYDLWFIDTPIGTYTKPLGNFTNIFGQTINP